MKITDFINEYNSADEVGGESLIKAHVVRLYIPLEEKQARAEQIIGSAYYDSEDRVHVNSVARYMLTALSYVLAYTDLEIAEGESLSAYNLLAQAGFFQRMQSYIPADEAEEFANIIDMVASDVLTNEYEPGAYIRARLENLALIMEPVLREVRSQLNDEAFKENVAELINKLNEVD